MALSINASEVIPGTNAVLAQALAGEAITAGQPILVIANVAYNTNNDPEDRAGVCHGIACHSTLTGQPCNYIVSGDLEVDDALMGQGLSYYVGNADGEIEAESGVSDARCVTRLGVARLPNTLVVNIDMTGAVIAK